MPGHHGDNVSRREGVPPTTVDEGPAISVGSASSAWPITPFGMNSPCSAARDDGFTGNATGEAFGSATDNTARAVFRQVEHRAGLAFTPCRRAMSATDAPGRTASATIRRFLFIRP